MDSCVQVRGKTHPRCYYKCTHPGCPVRKQEERIPETGEVVERIYRGLHNHAPPGQQGTSEGVSQSGSRGGAEPSTSADSGPGSGNISGASGGFSEGGDAAFSGQNLSGQEEVFTGADGEGEEGGKRKREEGSGEGSEEEVRERERASAALKQRRMDIAAVGASHVVEQQTLVLEVRSEVEILDDGYRWRKYGQKVVRGNPNPRYVFAEALSKGGLTVGHDHTCRLGFDTVKLVPLSN